MNAGVVRQDELITHRHPMEDIHAVMEEATKRPEGFVKSVLTFA